MSTSRSQLRELRTNLSKKISMKDSMDLKNYQTILTTLNRTKLGHQITPHMEGRATFETSKNLKFRQKISSTKKIIASISRIQMSRNIRVYY